MPSFKQQIKFNHFVIFVQHNFPEMKNKIWIAALALLSFVACRTPLTVASVDAQKNINITPQINEDAAFVKVIEPYKAALESKMNTKISYTAVDLNKNGDNSNLGNLLADFTLNGAQEWASKNNRPKVDAAVINIGGIRSTIGKGDVLTKHVFEVMPFENEVVIMKMKGADMPALFQYYAENAKNNPVAGLTIGTNAGKVETALVNGQPVNPARDYYIATSDYLALGGDNMKFFTKGELISTGMKLRDLFLDYFKRNPQVVAPTDIRLTFKGN